MMDRPCTTSISETISFLSSLLEFLIMVSRGFKGTVVVVVVVVIFLLLIVVFSNSCVL